jgi:NAD(P)-dependent dehydrogenase (short-subunit alcohol dehydrogenase family)
VAQDDLSGQVALVTGGGRGIGANIARELADAGMRVAVAARTAEQVELVAQEIDGISFEVDVSDEPSVGRMVEEIRRELGPIDLLVNNAGVTNPSDAPPIWEERPGDWWRVFEINLLGAYLCCRAVLDEMVETADRWTGAMRAQSVASLTHKEVWLRQALTPWCVSGTALQTCKEQL